MKYLQKYFFLIVILLILDTKLFAKNIKEVTFSSFSWPPYAYIDLQGASRGIYIDILKIIFEKRLNIKVKYEVAPWKRAQLNAETGKVDILITVPTQKRLEYSIKSDKEILNMYLSIFTYKDHLKIDNINKIKAPLDIKNLDLKSVTNLGNLWHKRKVESIGVDTYYVPKEENAFMVLGEKRCDISIEPMYAGIHLINKLHLKDKVVPTDGRLGPLKFYLLISKKSKLIGLIDEINIEIDRIKSMGVVDQILEKYSHID